MGVILRDSGLVSWVIIDRVDKANSLDLEHASELAQALGTACSSASTRVVAVRGAGDRFFSTGIDLGVVAGIRGDGALEAIVDDILQVFRAINDCSKPVIAAVNGHALGLGFELVMLSDLAAAVEWARLGVPAARWGMVAPVTPVLGPVLLGLKASSMLLFTGRSLTAREAHELGIINDIAGGIDGLESWVHNVASDVSKSSMWAVAEARRLMRRAFMDRLEAGLLHLAYSASRMEARERARRFFEERRR